MEAIKEKENEANISIIENDIYFKTYIKNNNNKILSYNPENVISKINTDDFICPICFNILKNPISCSDKKISHAFCKECIDIFLEESNKCPICKLTFEYKINNNIIKELNNLSFKCLFKNNGCNEILIYSDYLDHIINCKYNNIQFECKVKKYDYKSKDFKECGYLGNKKEIEKHFKLCGLTEYNCIICKEKILKINFEEHVKNKCIFRICNYHNGNRYEGYWKNDKKEGFGIYYFLNGDRYEGEWKNNLREGIGIYYYSNGDIYEGEYKNDEMEGIGIYYFFNGDRYEGEWKNNLREGYGILYLTDGDRYEGEWKNNLKEGYGILYMSNGIRYEGEWKNGKLEGIGMYYYSGGDIYKGELNNDLRGGYGIYYYSDGDRYEGEWKNNLREGIGIYNFSDGDKYEGEYKNDEKEGIGIHYFFNGAKYEGEWKNGVKEGYGIFYYCNGDRYEGEWKNDNEDGYGIVYHSNGDRFEGRYKNGFPEGSGIFYSSYGWKIQRYFKYNIKDRFLFCMYRIILFLYNLYLSVIRNKERLLFIIILIIGILIK